MSEKLSKEVLDRVDEGRRGFVKKSLMMGGFATPLMASFRMDSLSVGSARRVQFGNQDGGGFFSGLIRLLLYLLGKIFG